MAHGQFYTKIQLTSCLSTIQPAPHEKEWRVVESFCSCVAFFVRQGVLCAFWGIVWLEPVLESAACQTLGCELVQPHAPSLLKGLQP